MILIVSNNPEESEQIKTVLADGGYAGETVPSLEILESRLQQSSDPSILIDIDSVPIDNHGIRTLTLKYPSSYFFGMSRDKFHPELKDAICYHIYACIKKPIDPEELIYWMRCVDHDKDESRGPP